MRQLKYMFYLNECYTSILSNLVLLHEKTCFGSMSFSNWSILFDLSGTISPINFTSSVPHPEIQHKRTPFPVETSILTIFQLMWLKKAVEVRHACCIQKQTDSSEFTVAWHSTSNILQKLISDICVMKRFINHR